MFQRYDFEVVLLAGFVLVSKAGVYLQFQAIVIAIYFLFYLLGKTSFIFGYYYHLTAVGDNSGTD